MRLLAVILFIVITVFLTTIYVGQHLVAAWAMILTIGVIWGLTWIYALVPTYFNHKMRFYERCISESSTEQSPPHLLAKFNHRKSLYVSAQIATSVVAMMTLWYVLVTTLPTHIGGQVDQIEIIHFGGTLMLTALLMIFGGCMLTLLALPITFGRELSQSRRGFKVITKAVNLGFGTAALGSAIVWYTMCARVVGAAHYSYRSDFWEVYRSVDAVGAVIGLSLISILIWDFCFEGKVLQLKTLKSKYI